MSLFIAVLFFVLTPGIFLSLPANSSFRMKAMFHAVVFALIYHLTHKMVWNALYGGYSEGFAMKKNACNEDGKNPTLPPCP